MDEIQIAIQTIEGLIRPDGTLYLSEAKTTALIQWLHTIDKNTKEYELLIKAYIEAHREFLNEPS